MSEIPEIAHVITDSHTRIILFFAPSRLTAVKLAEGMLNTWAHEFVIHENFLSGFIKNIDRNRDIVYLKQSYGYPVRATLISDYAHKEEVYQKRELLGLRSKYLYDLELLCKTQLTRTRLFVDPAVGPFLLDQLKQCDPKNDFYTLRIHEYADINQIPVDTAYQELMLRTQSADLIRFRVQAFYDKYSHQLNGLSKPEDFDRVMMDVRYKLYLISYV